MDQDQIQSLLRTDFLHGETFQAIRGLFIALDVILAIGVAYLIIKMVPYLPKFEIAPALGKKTLTAQTAYFRDRWQVIMKKFSMGSSDSIRVAIIEADSLVDEALKQRNIQGDHFADRLEKLDAEEFRTLDRLWNAHRIRNDLAHTPGFVLTAHDAKSVLESYEAFLKELGAF